jgi:hypothetical protein
MVARTRRVATLAAGSLATLGSLAVVGALTTGPAGADSICPTTLLPGQLCATVDTVTGTLTATPTTQPTTATTQPTTATTQPTTQPTTDTTSPPTTAAPLPTAPSLPVPSIPLLPGPTSPVPDPSSPPSNEGTAPASSTSPGAGDSSPASHPATTNRLAGSTSASSASVGGARPVVAPIVNGAETARGFDLPALSGNGTASSPFALGPAPLPTTNAGARGISNELAAPLPAARSASTGGGGLPRPGAPITLAVLLVAGVLGAHGVRWIDRQMATATVTTTTR